MAMLLVFFCFCLPANLIAQLTLLTGVGNCAYSYFPGYSGDLASILCLNSNHNSCSIEHLVCSKSVVLNILVYTTPVLIVQCSLRPHLNKFKLFAILHSAILPSLTCKIYYKIGRLGSSASL